MPAWDRSLDLFVNVGASPDFVLLRSASHVAPADRPVFMQRDKFLLRLFLVRPANAGPLPPEILSIEDGDQIVFAGKLGEASGALLFSATDFTEVADAYGKHYEALLNLDTEELATALATELSIFANVDVEVQDSENVTRRRVQFLAEVRKAAYAGEGDPTPAAPAYPSPAALITTADDGANQKRGTHNLAAADYQNLAITFTTEFATPPTTVRAWVLKKAAADIIECAVNHDTITAAGFTVDLAAAVPGGTPTGDYKLSWLAIL